MHQNSDDLFQRFVDAAAPILDAERNTYGDAATDRLLVAVRADIERDPTRLETIMAVHDAGMILASDDIST